MLPRSDSNCAGRATRENNESPSFASRLPRRDEAVVAILKSFSHLMRYEGSRRMLEESSYWDCVFQLIEYAVDGATEAPITVDGRELVRLDTRRFIDDLYRPWPDQTFELRLQKALLTSVPLVCIVAPKGSGKTSSIRYVLHHLRSEHPEVQSVLVDVKKFFDLEEFAKLTDETALGTFRSEVRKIVEASLLPNMSDSVELLAWVLSGSSDTSDPFNSALLAELRDDAMEAQIEFGCGGMVRAERVRLLSSALSAPAAYSRYSRSVRSKLRTAHVVQAAVSLGRASKVLLVFDNVDRIPTQYQSKFMQAINDSHNALAGACVTAIAIRKETLHSPRPNKHGDVITMVLPDDERYPCVLLPENKGEHVQDVLECRHRFSRALLDELLASLPEESLRLDILDPIHNSILSEVINNSIHALANGSIRTTASIYTEFVRYLLTLQDRGISLMTELAQADPDHLQTLFFVWLRTRASSYGLVFYDVIKADADARHAREFADLASEHHLLLTCVHNLAEEQHMGADPTVYDVFDRMLRLGFTESRVRGALKTMSAPPGGAPATIEFSNDETEVPDRHSSAHVRLTSLGSVLIADLLDKVGYAWGKALDRAVLPPEKQRNYHAFNRVERMRLFLDYVRDLAKYHLRLLSLLRARRDWGRVYGTSWLTQYRRQFGLNRRFQIERLLESAYAFYGPYFGDGENSFRKLLAIYTRAAAAACARRPVQRS